ncbi:peptidoglycan DD-metalloendopeptidase family protein [Pimelobacter simplex]|uniref:peptidoglycan DD-metalloendopeptidase family protein n=1 Tax=Nocardioides simplex TaxID=2045 RepID=UPI0020B15C7A|nr:peptidoglycan DD-metalloendopeptidase family protein [Pimelobacter simplex]
MPALALALILAVAVALALPALALAAPAQGGADPAPSPRPAPPRPAPPLSPSPHSAPPRWTPALPARAAAPGSVDPVGTWPLTPVPAVVRRFDPPDLPYGTGHRGVDLAGRPGQEVRSALPGRVTFAGRIAGRGVVVVGHGPTRTTYEPVTASVSVGASVPAGAVLGRLELAGSHCLPNACLHWGWIAGRTYLDPLRLVDAAGPVRLLPLTGERAPEVGSDSTGRRTGGVGADVSRGVGSLARLGADAISARAP